MWYYKIFTIVLVPIKKKRYAPLVKGHLAFTRQYATASSNLTKYVNRVIRTGEAVLKAFFKFLGVQSLNYDNLLLAAGALSNLFSWNEPCTR